MSDHPVADALTSVGKPAADATVEVRYEVVRLLSDQLYASPLKAIEELVVNAWDADATECRIHVPQFQPGGPGAVIVLDNGAGLSIQEMSDLWHVGQSRKRDESWATRYRRTQIGKFGIGKLATYALGRQVTYISKRDNQIHGVTLNFAQFEAASRPDGTSAPIPLKLLAIPGISVLQSDAATSKVFEGTGVDLAIAKGWRSWTLVIIEEPTPKAAEIRAGRLHWVLSTAMPLAPDFQLRLNGTLVESAKELQANWAVTFEVADLDEARLTSLEEKTGGGWHRTADALVSNRFPSGIRGTIRVSDQTLYYGKSSDLGRSHGFFIRVRNRLINEDDPLFGATPLSFTTFYNLHAVVDADDLDQYLKAPRDDVEQSEARSDLHELLRQLFNQARDRYEGFLEEQAEGEKRKKEGVRSYAAPRLIERPLADSLINSTYLGTTYDAWTLVEPGPDPETINQLIESLYADPPAPRPYRYRTEPFGETGPLVRFAPGASEFILNEDHDLVQEYWDNFHSRRVLQLLATAEALLEVYLRDYGVHPGDIAVLLTRRDQLLRSLARSNLYSLRSIGRALRQAASDERDLEVAAVAACRALGFVTSQISGADQPDGIAHYAATSKGPAFTIEAKSSKSVPSLGAIDFAGLREHADSHEAPGCLLVAPAYPGGSRGEDAQAARRAKTARVSCWTIDQLASAVEMAEARRINANEILDIVSTSFTPPDVATAVTNLLSTPAWIHAELRVAVLDALDAIQTRMKNTPRTAAMLATEVSRDGRFAEIEATDVAHVLDDLSHASNGMLHITESGEVWVRGSVEELRRRLANAALGPISDRRAGGLIQT